MMKINLPYVLLIGLTGILLSGCGHSYTVIKWQKNQKQEKSQRDVVLLRNIAMQNDNDRRLERLNRMNTPKNSNDPVFLNMLASAWLIEGTYSKAVELFKEVNDILSEHGHNYYTTSNNLPGYLAIPHQKRSSIRITATENAAILTGIAEKVQHNRRYALLDGLRNRSGHIPDPPVLKGIIGLGLESLNESTNRAMFYPIIIPYNQGSVNRERQNNKAIEYALRNLFLAQLLDKDFIGFEQTVRKIQQLDRTRRSLQTETYLAVGLFVIGDQNWKNHINSENRALFRSLRQISARFHENKAPVTRHIAAGSSNP